MYKKQVNGGGFPRNIFIFSKIINIDIIYIYLQYLYECLNLYFPNNFFI